jgi:hypothetical protein
VVGVPVRAPADVRFKPGGKASPDGEGLQVYEPFPPVAVKVTLYVPPTIALGTFKVETERGGGLVIVKFSDREVPPSFPGLFTVMLALPTCARLVLGTTADSSVPLSYVVVKDVEFHITIDADEKFDPVAVSVKPLPPASALVGDSLLKTGAPPWAFAIGGTASQTNSRTKCDVFFIKASPGQTGLNPDSVENFEDAGRREPFQA